MTNEQELRKLKEEAQELKFLSDSRDERIRRLEQRIDAALERKPKFARRTMSAGLGSGIVGGVWYPIIYEFKRSDGNYEIMVKGENGGYSFVPTTDLLSVGGYWELHYDDTPPAEEPMPCPECGENVNVFYGYAKWACKCENDKCRYLGNLGSTREAAIALHNWMARQLHGMKEH